MRVDGNDKFRDAGIRDRSRAVLQLLGVGDDRAGIGEQKPSLRRKCGLVALAGEEDDAERLLERGDRVLTADCARIRRRDALEKLASSQTAMKVRS